MHCSLRVSVLALRPSPSSRLLAEKTHTHTCPSVLTHSQVAILGCLFWVFSSWLVFVVGGADDRGEREEEEEVRQLFPPSMMWSSFLNRGRKSLISCLAALALRLFFSQSGRPIICIYTHSLSAGMFVCVCQYVVFWGIEWHRGLDLDSNLELEVVGPLLPLCLPSKNGVSTLETGIVLETESADYLSDIP